ncbi:MAG: DUF6120 family protein [Emergencia sp.]|nr:DUF6120 family protein [Emergencia sp.]
MQQTRDKALKQYFKQIKLLLPIYSKEEKIFINDLKKVIDEYIESNPNCTYEEILERFEEPTDVVFNYISCLDQHELCKKISLRKIIKRAIIIVVLAAIVTCSIRIILYYDSYLEYKNTIITHERVVIE